MKKNYLTMLLVSVATLFALFVFAFSARPDPNINLSPGYTGIITSILPLIAFSIGLFIVVTIALLILITVDRQKTIPR